MYYIKRRIWVDMLKVDQGPRVFAILTKQHDAEINMRNAATPSPYIVHMNYVLNRTHSVVMM